MNKTIDRLFGTVIDLWRAYVFIKIQKYPKLHWPSRRSGHFSIAQCSMSHLAKAAKCLLWQQAESVLVNALNSDHI